MKERSVSPPGLAAIGAGLALAAGLAFTAGFWLRVRGLDDQVVQGDERWTLQVALEHTPAYILTRHDSMSFSVPLALWNWLLANTVGLGEWGMRLPVLLCGVVALPLLWRFVQRHFGAAEAVVVVWIAALSPVLVLYSRFARPYIGVFVASLLAIIGWWGWLERRSRRHAALMAVAGASAIYLHLLAAAAIAALWGLAIAFDAWGAAPAAAPARVSAFRRGRSSAGWALAGAGLVVLALAPSLSSLVSFAADKQGVHLATLETWSGALHVLFGTLHGPLLLWWSATAVLGAVVCWRTAPRLAFAFAAMFAVQALAIAVLAPRMSMWAYVAARYLMPALPGLLVFSALGLLTQGRWLARQSFGRLERTAMRPRLVENASVALAVGLVIGSAALGPLPAVNARPHSFTNHPDYYSPPGPQLVAAEVPEFYRFLAAEPDPLSVLEAPDTRLFFLTIYGFYQDLHGHRVRTVSAAAAMADDRLALRSVLPAARIAALSAPNETRGPNELRAPIGFDFLVVHRSLADEFRTVSPFANVRRDRALDPESPWFDPGAPARVARYDRAASQLLALFDADPRLERVWEERWLVVYAGNAEAARRIGEWKRASRVTRLKRR